MSDGKSGAGFGVGLIVGMAVGAIIGFLFAPRSGKETRDTMKDKADDVSATIKDLTSDRKKVYTETWKDRRDQPKVKSTYFE
ncbi:MAG TPA: YtxH domain-containing protein [Dehalococcoidia bacterium]|jgi:gas vesicle protein